MTADDDIISVVLIIVLLICFVMIIIRMTMTLTGMMTMMEILMLEAPICEDV